MEYDDDIQIAIEKGSPPSELPISTQVSSGDITSPLSSQKPFSSTFHASPILNPNGNYYNPTTPFKSFTTRSSAQAARNSGLIDSNADPVTLTFENITYSIPLEGHDNLYKILLNNVSGVVRPGQVLAIMGPSGGGKTTLLDVLSGRANRGRLTPETSILVNGKERDRFFKKISGYVMQDDSLIETLTVEEALMYTAELRLPRSVSTATKKRRVADVIKQLGLTKVRHNRIGSQFHRGLSGGERRRVSIGVELLTGCRLLFLDEPTSGLDGASAFSVTQSLSHIAKYYNRTVVCTIHQPRSSTFKSFDLLLLLSEGQVIYFGNPVGAIQYFGSLGYQCDNFTNPADFMLDLITDAPDNEEYNDGSVAHSKIVVRKELVQQYFASNAKRVLDSEISQVYEAYHVTIGKDPSSYFSKFKKFKKNFSLFGESEFAISRWFQFWILLRRTFLTLIRTPAILRVRMVQACVMALLVGSIYFQVGKEQSDIQRRTSAIFFVCVYQTLSAISAIATFIEERGRFNRERLSGFYSTFAYFLAVSCAQIPVLLTITLTFGSIVYWMVGFQPTLEHFGIFLLIETLLCFVGDSICLFVSAAVGLLSVANSISTLCITFFLLFGGFFLPMAELPIYWRWANYITPFKYSYEALMINEFRGLNFTCSPTEVNPATGECIIPNGDAVLANVGIKDTFSIREDAIIVFSMFLILRICVYIALRFLNKEKR